MMSKKETIEQLEEKLKTTQNKINTLKSQERAKERKLETRRNILVGAVIRKLSKKGQLRILFDVSHELDEDEYWDWLGEQEGDEWCEMRLSTLLQSHLTEKDLKAFDLDAEDYHPPTIKSPSSTCSE